MLKYATSLYGYKNRPEEMYVATQKMYFLSFINSAIIIQLVYMDIGDIPGLDTLGKYDQFS